MVIEKAGENLAVDVPDLPGCIATDRSVSEVERLIREVISFHFEGFEADGIDIPELSWAVEYVELPA